MQRSSDKQFGCVEAAHYLHMNDADGTGSSSPQIADGEVIRSESDPTFSPIHDHLHPAFGLGAFSKRFPSRLSPPGRRCTHPPRLRLTQLETRTPFLNRRL
jgi:hypothetical protein